MMASKLLLNIVFISPKTTRHIIIVREVIIPSLSHLSEASFRKHTTTVMLCNICIVIIYKLG